MNEYEKVVTDAKMMCGRVVFMDEASSIVGSTSSDFARVLDWVLGKDNENVTGKRVSEIIQLFQGVIYPLPSSERLNEILVRFPDIRIAKDEKDEGSIAVLTKLRIEDDAVRFDTVIHEKDFRLEADVVSELMGSVVRIAFLTFLHSFWSEKMDSELVKAD